MIVDVEKAYEKGNNNYNIVDYPVKDWKNFVTNSEELEYIPDVEYGTINGRALKLDILKPKISTPKKLIPIVYLHGGGWYAGSNKNYHTVNMALNGYFTVNVDYRLSGEAKFPAQIQDCKASVRWLRANSDKLGINGDKIGVYGHSAGGHLASLMGTSSSEITFEGTAGWNDFPSHVNAVIACSAPSDISLLKNGHMGQELVGGPLEEHRHSIFMANPINHILNPSNEIPPFLILHGEDDTAVPIEHAYKLYKALESRKLDVTMCPLKNTGHYYAADNNSKFKIERIWYMLEFFKKL